MRGAVGAEASVPNEAYLDQIKNESVRLEDGRILVMVQLNQSPAADAFVQAGGETAGAAAEASARAQDATVRQAQDAFVQRLPSLGINAERISSTSFVLNSVTVAVSPDQIQQLQAAPDVQYVYPVVRLDRETSTSIPQIGAPSAWNGTFGGAYTGAGQVIAVIDSGVDYSHRNFGGPGTWPTNPADRTTLADGGFQGSKVIGGYDYVGDYFNGGNPEASGLPAVTTLSPDPDPIDCTISQAALASTFGVTPGQAPSGHGSHVAGIAAGFGVTSGGATYTGGYTSVPFGSLSIGPGSAPEADLLAFRVFGCFGSTFSNIPIQAIDDAVSGRYASGVQADVINMSLGSAFGAGSDNPALEPYTIAITNATAAGTVVVTSAGNSYDTFFTTGSPGSTGAALSTASTVDGGYNGIVVSGTTADGNYPAANSVGAPMNTTVGPLPIAQPAGNGCSAANYSGFPANHIAIVQFSAGCGSAGLASAAVGASPNKPLGLLVISNTATGFQNLACTPGTPYIPCVSIEASTGALLLANIGTAQVTMDPTLLVSAPALTDAISTFSSRGPRRGDTTSGIKPDIAAPGDSITSTGAGLGSGSQNLGGTSMASPTVAGVVALIRSNPTYANWPAWQIKALLMNTANNDVFTGTTSGPQTAPQRAGTGRVDVPDAMSNQVIAFNALYPYLVGVSFGDPEVVPGSPQTFTRDVTIMNKGAADATYNLAIDTVTNANIASFSVSPGSVTVPAYSSVNVTVTLTVNTAGASVHNNSDAGLTLTQSTAIGTLPRHYLTEEGALLILTPTAGATVPLRVQLYAAPRAASQMRAATSEITIDGLATGSSEIEMSGTGVFSGGSFPADIVSSVTALKLTGVDAVGDTTFPVPSLDVQYVGASSNYNDGGSNPDGTLNSDTTVFVGLSTVGDWSTPNEYFISVYIDGNQDGFGFASDDYFVFTTAPNLSGTTSRSDVFFTAAGLNALGSGFYHEYLNFPSANFDMQIFNNNVLNLVFYPGLALNYDNNTATPATGMLAPGDTDFNFYVEMYSRSLGEVIDESPVMYFDLANPVIDTGNVPIWDDVNGNLVPFDYDLSAYTPDPDVPLGLLLLHHHNVENVTSVNGTNFRRAEVVLVNVGDITTPTPTPPPPTNLLTNGDFSAGLPPWYTFGEITYQITGGVMEFYQNVGGSSAVIVQNSGASVPNSSGLLANIDIGNSSASRKRAVILLHDSDFSDLQVCSFWVPAGSSLNTYSIETFTTEAWTDASISIYVTPADGQGWLQVDNAELFIDNSLPTDETNCYDPLAPAPGVGADSANMIVNGSFTSGLTPWFTFGQIVSQITGGVFEFYRPAGTPAGVVAQFTDVAVAANTPVEAQFQLGNSSSVRKRVTVLVHDLDFSDLQVCTFWLPPSTPLQDYAIRTFATTAWDNAMFSVYPATIGTEQWLLLDNVSLVTRPTLDVAGSECYEPSAVGGLGLAGVAELPLPESSETPTEAPESTLPRVESDSADVSRVGEWQSQSEPAGASGDSYLINVSPEAALTLRFAGTAADVLYVSGPSFGAFDVLVDGVTVQSVVATTPEYGFAFTSVTGLADGEHVLGIVPQGVVAIDAFGVTSVLPPVEATPVPTLELPTAVPTDVPTEPPTEPPVETPVVEPPTATPTPLPLVLPVVATMDDGAADWLHTDAWTLTADAAFGGLGLGWQAQANLPQTDRLRWDRWIDLTTAQAVRLSFQSLLSNSAAGSTALVQISTDGVNWLPVAQVTPSADWTLVELDLSQYAGQFVQIEFVWNGAASTDENAVADLWQVDNVALEAYVPTPVPTLELPTVEPTATAEPTATEAPVTEVEPTAAPTDTPVPPEATEVVG